MRYLIGFAFVPSGLTKLMGNRFTTIPISNPIGFFFEAMYQTGIYWQFLGFTQIIAALLLMTQRFATLGNLIFLGIITNIFLITFSMDFTGTVYITFLLLIASIGLLLWDFPKWKTLFFSDNFTVNIELENLPTYNTWWIYTGVIFFIESLLFSILSSVFKDVKTVMALLVLIVVTAIVSLVLYKKYGSAVRRD
ncbi:MULTISPECIES: hypothetical protein [unclassified Arcicella]|uniref:hypothetical protein n=1 Tax=unclassified Arcicella TaxID=2644986 RepID=UPI002856EC80|nr:MULTISPECIES: hypothetical protein [unclassified Arcicella]MDR6561068.1 hypothetical protein [Arcicella sp. BE51]MDR6810952.1 hypothetical protein [Arcicella sp. BE140]MDR6822302.1 hypothetical protein [Arcicella sp. BE139]